MAKPAEKTENNLTNQDMHSISPWREAWKEFKKNKIAVVGLLIVLFFILLAIFATFITKEGINEQVMTDRIKPPSKEYWLGTDDFGRDIFSRIIHGAKSSVPSQYSFEGGFIRSVITCSLIPSFVINVAKIAKRIKKRTISNPTTAILFFLNSFQASRHGLMECIS